MSDIIKVFKEGNLVKIQDQQIDPFRDFGFPANFIFYIADPNQEKVAIYAQQDVRQRDFISRSYTFFRDGSDNPFATYGDLITYLSTTLGLADGSGFTQDVNVVNQPTVTVDDSTPVDVNVTNQLTEPLDVEVSNQPTVTVDDSTPVDVNVTNQLTEPLDVEVSNQPTVKVDDSTPVDVNVTNDPINVQYAQNLPLFDAGGNLRISQNNTLVDIQMVNDEQPLLYDRENISGATQTYSQPLGGVTMSVSPGQKAIAQQKFFNHYFAGKSQVALLTFSGFAPEVDVIKRVGYFSSSTVSPYSANIDGIYLESSDQIYLVVVKDGTEKLRVAQSSWNIDTGSFIDFDNFNVFTFDFLYLGGTGVRFSFYNGREVIPVHVFDHASLFSDTILLSPSQPVRYEIESIGGTGSMVQICAEVGTENTPNQVGLNNTFATFDFQANSAGNIYAVLGLRLQSTLRNVLILFKELSFMAETNDDLSWILCFNPTISGPAITFGNIDGWGTLNNTSLEVAIGAGGGAGGANLITDVGTRIVSGSFNGNTFNTIPIENSIKLGSFINGTMDEVWLGIRPVSAGLDVFPHINLDEF